MCLTYFQLPGISSSIRRATRNPTSTSCIRRVIKIVCTAIRAWYSQEKQGRLRDEDAFVRGQGIAVGCRRRVVDRSQRCRVALSQQLDEDNTATGRWEQRPAQRQKFSGPWKSHGRGSLRPCAPPIDPSPPQQPRSPTASTTGDSPVNNSVHRDILFRETRSEQS